jgi:hypothetical protein
MIRKYKSVITIEEAREILGDEAKNMSDEEIENTIETLDLLAVEALDKARQKRISEDAAAMAELIYDIHKDKKKSG